MSKKRSNGEGTIIFHKASERYMAQYTKPNGKRGTIYGKTKREVSQKLTKTLAEIHSEKYIEPSKKTLIEIMEKVVQDRYESNVTGENGYRTNLDIMKRIRKSPIATMQIQKITEEDVQEYLNSLTTKYADNTIRKDCYLLSATFRRATVKGYVRRNIFDNKEELKRPKSKKVASKISALTLTEQSKLEKALKEYNNAKIRNIILLALRTGMRSGEILALKINDIDLENKVIHIRRTLTKDVAAKVIIGETTKTYNSTRDIKIDELTETILRNSIGMYEFNPYNVLFSENGKFLTGAKVNIKFKQICRDNKINKGYDVNFHMLRHTFATRCIESGMPANVVQKKLGHHDVEITLNQYTDVFAKFEESKTKSYIEYLKENKVVLQ